RAVHLAGSAGSLHALGRSLVAGGAGGSHGYRQKGFSMPANLPVIPMRGSVLLPGVTLPIAAARPATLRAIEAALGGNRRVFAVAQRVDSEEVVPESLYTIGTIATIESVQRGL